MHSTEQPRESWERLLERARIGSEETLPAQGSSKRQGGCREEVVGRV